MHLPLTPYGARELAVGTCAAALLVCLCLWAWPPLIVLPLALWICLVAFFRDPQRSGPRQSGLMLSPADGVVRDITEVDSPAHLMQGPVVRIGIFMSILNVHVNRSPADAIVRLKEYHRGAHLDARDTEAPRRNEHCLLGLELPGGRPILVNQVAGMVARRIVCAPVPGDQLRAAQRFGMIKFGSRVELFVPATDETCVLVRVGDRVRAGLTPLARLAEPVQLQ